MAEVTLRLELARQALMLVRTEIKSHGRILSDNPENINVMDAALSYGKCYKVTREEIKVALEGFPDLQEV